MSNRPETGPMRFGDDWAGVFMRGDDAGYYAMALELLRDKAVETKPHLMFTALSEILSILRGCLDEHRVVYAQQLKPWGECQQEPTT